MQQAWRSCLFNNFFGCMVCRTKSFPTAGLPLSQLSGSLSSVLFLSNLPHRLRITRRPMVRPRGQTTRWKHIYDISSVIDKTIGQIGCRLRSSVSIIPRHRLPNSLPFSLGKDFILEQTASRLRLRSHAVMISLLCSSPLRSNSLMLYVMQRLFRLNLMTLIHARQFRIYRVP